VAEIVVLVPVLGRPANAAPLVESLAAATTVPHRCLFICSPDDDQQIKACEATSADLLVVEWGPGQGDYARKINRGFDASDEPWAFLAADDLNFHPGWDERALETFTRTGVGVIGTQDLGNPRVKRGHHSTHSLVSRAYIDQYGSGTVDNSGRVLCELYSHQFVDNELVETAKTRGQFAFSPKSVVEHLHPHWGHTEMDDTYAKALQDGSHDGSLYIRRSHLFGTNSRRRA
jgi:glycosyltransferase involved in cell wall biosynthesis